MTTPHTQPAALERHDGALPASDFRLQSRREIAALLRELCRSGTPIRLSSPEGADLATLIWSVDEDAARLCLRAAEDHPHLQALIESDEVTAVAFLDCVKLQFELHDMVLVRGIKACALQAALPMQLYRFQRRQTFRVRAPLRLAPTAGLRHPAIPDMQLKLRVLDLSIGGCALLLPDDVPDLRAGSTLHGVRFVLDSGTQFTASLMLHHISSMRHPGLGVRLGCELLELDSAGERSLQRYIDQTQKRARLLRLG